MSFINEIISLNDKIDSANEKICNLQDKKYKLENSLNSLVIKTIKDSNIENIVSFIKEVCIKKQKRNFHISFYGEIYFGIFLENINDYDFEMNRIINFENKKINLILDNNKKKWLMFKINNETNIGFYLKLFDLNLSDINTTELDSIDLESYKYIVKFIENNIFK